MEDMAPRSKLAGEETSPSATQSRVPEVPELLFHTVLTVVDLSGDVVGADNRRMYPLAAHADLPAAKAFARDALGSLGYKKSDFESYRTWEDDAKGNDGGQGDLPPMEDGVLVQARRPGPHEFLVSIITSFNTEELPADRKNPSNLKLPDGTDRLHYVVQNKIDYNADRSGAVQTFDLEGVYVHRGDAYVAAKQCLLGDPFEKADFEEYDERDEESFAKEWPYGEDVVVHAVMHNGENFKVSVLTTLRAHQLHGKHASG